MNKQRVVITGMGVVSPIGNGIKAFEKALFSGKSGIKAMPELEEYGFRTLLGAVPEKDERLLAIQAKYRTQNGSDMLNYALAAALDAWENAGFTVPDDFNGPADPDTGAIIGTGMGAVDSIGGYVVPQSNPKGKRRLRSTVVEQNMPNAPAAHVSQALGLGNRISAVSSACATGTEAIITAAERIADGRAVRMLAGGSEAYSPWSWIGFDVMRVLAQNKNDDPKHASCPLSSDASGFVPGAGAGIMLLESLESAKKRGAKILAEYKGGFINSGGMRAGGSMTAPSAPSVIACIKSALHEAGISPDEVDYINGHLSSTMADVLEIENLSKALNRYGPDFPFINSLKAQTGHCIGAGGGIESIASVLQIKNAMVTKAVNSRPLHPHITEIVDESRVPLKNLKHTVNTVLKTSFGFGDVNACMLLKRL
ncbi:MAG TPA: beta-ketoacyl-[acyl-carrier-protein] synthase family protein [Bacteroidales bacterium]|nr:beta-ketoacyl-[acyl-carrier-protein] synthase family protein [Bacteroidales bacterium]